MGGFNSYDEILTGFTNGERYQKLWFQKVFPSTTVTLIPHTMWKANGIPTAGTDATTGAANGRVLTSSSTGAIPYNNATSGRTMYTLGAGALALTNITGTLILIDRISDVNLNYATIGTTTITGLDASSRMSSRGAKLWIEVTTALGASAASITVNYTNQSGTPGRSCVVTGTSGAAIGRSINGHIWQNLQAGDTGIQSVQSYSITSGNTGTMNICLVEPVCYIPLYASPMWNDRDLIVEVPDLEALTSSCCFSGIIITNGAATPTLLGEIKLMEN